VQDSDYSIEITGIKELNKSLYAFSRKLGDKVVIDSMKQGARLVQRQAKRNAPKRTGMLRRGIVVRKSKIHNGRRRPTIGVYLGLRKGKGKDDPKDAFYGRFIEDGFKPRGKSNRVKGRKFIKNAFRQQKNNAVRLIIASARRGADIIAAKMGLR
jgi:HK97 gp10 family phage protein